MATPTETDDAVREIITWLTRRGTKANREGMARYAIRAKKVFGVSVGDLRTIGKKHRRNHPLALALWKSGWYEARMLTAFVDDPAQVTPAQMDRWCRDFDNWAICDALCFHLFDKTPHAFAKMRQWSREKGEFQKRAAFALMASVALHHKKADDRLFLPLLPLIERASSDDRNFVKKGVSWALRGIGRRSATLHKPATALATKLAGSDDPTARWIGRDALRDLNRK
jgi:3-methyladenine DNA glycosylase AlkD